MPVKRIVFTARLPGARTLMVSPSAMKVTRAVVKLQRGCEEPGRQGPFFALAPAGSRSATARAKRITRRGIGATLAFREPSRSAYIVVARGDVLPPSRPRDRGLVLVLRPADMSRLHDAHARRHALPGVRAPADEGAHGADPDGRPDAHLHPHRDL